MCFFNHFLAMFLALILLSSPIQATIQIVNPAPRAKTLDLNPPPNLRWVYGNDDPKIIGILIRQIESDVNASDIGDYRYGTRTEWSSAPLYFAATNVTAGMNVTISIVDPSNTDVVHEMPILDSVGPLLLREGHTGVVPVASDGSGATNTTSSHHSATIGPTVNGTLTSSANDTIGASPTASTIISTDIFSTETATITSTPTSDAGGSAAASATSTTSSEADKTFGASVTYMVALLLLAVSAFVAGHNS